jgi:hypothetical protein
LLHRYDERVHRTIQQRKSECPGPRSRLPCDLGHPRSFNDTDIVDSKWLPRKAAEAQAAKDPNTMMVDDYADDPLVGEGKDYATGEELCNKHFTN